MLVFLPGKGGPVGDIIPEPIIKPDGIGPADDGPGKIDLLGLIGKPTPFLWLAVPEVPLANHAGGISFFLEHGGKGQPACFDKWAFPFVDDGPF